MVEDRQVGIQAGDFCAKRADDGAGIRPAVLEGKRKTAGGLLRIGEIVGANGCAGTVEIFVA